MAVGNPVENVLRRLEPKAERADEPQADEIEGRAELIEASGCFDLHVEQQLDRLRATSSAWRP